MNDIDKQKLKATARDLCLNPSELMISTALSYAYYLGASYGNTAHHDEVLKLIKERKPHGLGQ